VNTQCQTEESEHAAGEAPVLFCVLVDLNEGLRSEWAFDTTFCDLSRAEGVLKDTKRLHVSRNVSPASAFRFLDSVEIGSAKWTILSVTFRKF
jgi:hypothetical protein